MLIALAFRGTTYFADKNALKGSLNLTLKEALPTVFFGFPRVWEKIQEKMMEVGHQTYFNTPYRNWCLNEKKRDGGYSFLQHGMHW